MVKYKCSDYTGELIDKLEGQYFGKHDKYEKENNTYIWYGTMAGVNTQLKFYTLSEGNSYLEFIPKGKASGSSEQTTETQADNSLAEAKAELVGKWKLTDELNAEIKEWGKEGMSGWDDSDDADVDYSSEIEFAEDGTCTVVLYQAYYIGSSPFVAHGPSYSEYDIKRKGCLSLSFPNGTKEFEYSISVDSLSISLDDELKEYQHLNPEFIRQ